MNRTIYTTPILYPLLRAICQFGLKITGWKVIGQLPDLPKYIVIGAPHTSNWDFPVGLAAIFAADWRLKWVGKHTIFKRPWGGLMRWLGGSPINRSRAQGVVEAYVDAFNQQEFFSMVIAPEGTRSLVPKWKSGFYRIAVGANVPIVLGYIDKATKTVGIGHYIVPCGDFEQDMKLINAFYRDKQGIKAERFTPHSFD